MFCRLGFNILPTTRWLGDHPLAASLVARGEGEANNGGRGATKHTAFPRSPVVRVNFETKTIDKWNAECLIKSLIKWTLELHGWRTCALHPFYCGPVNKMNKCSIIDWLPRCQGNTVDTTFCGPARDTLLSNRKTEKSKKHNKQERKCRRSSLQIWKLCHLASILIPTSIGLYFLIFQALNFRITCLPH